MYFFYQPIFFLNIYLKGLLLNFYVSFRFIPSYFSKVGGETSSREVVGIYVSHIQSLPTSAGDVVWCKGRLENNYGQPDQNVTPVYEVTDNWTQTC